MDMWDKILQLVVHYLVKGLERSLDVQCCKSILLYLAHVKYPVMDDQTGRRPNGSTRAGVILLATLGQVAKLARPNVYAVVGVDNREFFGTMA